MDPVPRDIVILPHSNDRLGWHAMKSARPLSAICLFLAVPLPPSVAGDKCLSKLLVAQQVNSTAKRHGLKRPEFRITRQADGQALLYWRHGMDARSFYAVTFRANGCAVLNRSGSIRRFVFPRSGYNTGVFEEMARFDDAS